MIVMRHFNEAHQLYVENKLTFRLLQDQAAVMLGLCESSHRIINKAIDIIQDDIIWLLNQPAAAFDYSTYLGGDVFVCETKADLRQIKGCDFEWAEKHGSWPDVTDIPMSWDGCDFLEEKIGSPQWVMFLMCWNNAGGPLYYVPRSLWQLARVSEHIKATAS